MARSILPFAKGHLFFLAFSCGSAFVMFLGLGLNYHPGQRIPGLGLLRVFGPEGPRWGCFVLAAVVVVTALAALRRLVGGRPAAAIRHDGIELNGLFLSRYIHWSLIDRICLRSHRIRGDTSHSIRIESRVPAGADQVDLWLCGPSHDVADRLVAAQLPELGAWVEKAQAALSDALRPAPPRAVQSRAGFGRRAA
jgi:hypothetical protein